MGKNLSLRRAGCSSVGNSSQWQSVGDTLRRLDEVKDIEWLPFVQLTTGYCGLLSTGNSQKVVNRFGLNSVWRVASNLTIVYQESMKKSGVQGPAV
jgi:hypothetical protein